MQQNKAILKAFLEGDLDSEAWELSQKCSCVEIITVPTLCTKFTCCHAAAVSFACVGKDYQHFSHYISSIRAHGNIVNNIILSYNTELHIMHSNIMGSFTILCIHMPSTSR